MPRGPQDSHGFSTTRSPVSAAAPDHLVPEHVREGHQRRERVVAGAVQQDLLHVRAAQAREGRLDPHPVRRREREVVDVLDADRREAGYVYAPVHASADGRGRLAGQVVPEHERLHAPPSPGPPNLVRRRQAPPGPQAWRRPDRFSRPGQETAIHHHVDAGNVRGVADTGALPVQRLRQPGPVGPVQQRRCRPWRAVRRPLPPGPRAGRRCRSSARRTPAPCP